MRDLRNHLSAYLRRVEAGEVLVVTNGGRVVAELVPPGTTHRLNMHRGLLEMERQGLVRLATRSNDPSLYRRMPYVDSGGETVQDLIDFIREDRV